jgi:hypothetical protein
MLVNNVGLTGSTGYYTLILNNNRGSFTLNSGIFVNNPVDQFPNFAYQQVLFQTPNPSTDDLLYSGSPISNVHFIGTPAGIVNPTPYLNYVGWKLPGNQVATITEIILDNTICPVSFAGYLYSSPHFLPVTLVRVNQILLALYSPGHPLPPTNGLYYPTVPNDYLYLSSLTTFNGKTPFSFPGSITGVNKVVIWGEGVASVGHYPYLGDDDHIGQTVFY